MVTRTFERDRRSVQVALQDTAAEPTVKHHSAAIHSTLVCTNEMTHEADKEPGTYYSPNAIVASLVRWGRVS